MEINTELRMKTPTAYQVQQLYLYISTVIQLTQLDAGTNSQVLFFGQRRETNKTESYTKQDSQCTYNVILRRVRVTIVVV
jgi:hypothetical protein